MLDDGRKGGSASSGNTAGRGSMGTRKQGMGTMEGMGQGGRLGHRTHYGDRDGIGKGSSYRSFVSCRSGKLRFHRGSKRERDINTRLSAQPAETRGAAGGPLSPAFPHHVSTLHHIHCTSLQCCTQTLSLNTLSHLCSAQHHPLPVPQPHPAQQDSHPLSLELLASPLQYSHMPLLCSASQPGAGPSQSVP